MPGCVAIDKILYNNKQYILGYNIVQCESCLVEEGSRWKEGGSTDDPSWEDCECTVSEVAVVALECLFLEPIRAAAALASCRAVRAFSSATMANFMRFSSSISGLPSSRMLARLWKRDCLMFARCWLAFHNSPLL